MAVAWFVCGYVRRVDAEGAPIVPPERYCAMDDYTDIIAADGGAWSETEVLGGYALVKVRATEDTLTIIAGVTGILRIPRVWDLSTTLATLSTAQRTAIRNKILAMGYTEAEITAALGTNIAQRTLGQVLRFAAQRRLKPRWDVANDLIVLDGAYESCRSVDSVDAEVSA